MELPRTKKSGGGVLSGIKSKLGFASEKADEGYDDQYYDEGYDEEYGDYDEDYGEYGQDYQDDRGGYARSSSHGGSSGSGRAGSTSPNLVSIDDVRANTQVPDSLNRDPLPQRRVSGTQQTSAYAPVSEHRPSGYSRPQRAVERASDYLRSTETSDIPPGASAPRAHGYESLFAETASAAASAGAAAAAPASGKGYDPYDSYAGTGATSHSPSRSLSVLKPASYGEVERIAKILKSGDVVVLGLYNTQDQLAKRILDFSFGVSSALDANVECVADKVFVITRGSALTAEERMALRNQGVF